MRYAIACALVVLAVREARAEWPCAEHTRHRIARSAKGDKPIAIAAANDKPIYGKLAFVELNGDGRRDVVFESACIRSPADSVRLHRIYASCGRAADGIEEYVLIFGDEELCTRAVKIDVLAGQTKVNETSWQDLQLARTSAGPPCEQATEALRFDGARYKAGPRTSRSCVKP